MASSCLGASSGPPPPPVRSRPRSDRLDDHKEHLTACPKPVGMVAKVELCTGEVLDEVFVPCHRWKCTFCGRRNLFRVRRNLSELLEGFDHVVMMTLTLDPKRMPKDYDKDPEKTLGYINGVWDLFLKRMRRSDVGWFPVVCIRELQKRGNAHIHAFVPGWMPCRWMKRTWSECGGGYADVRRWDSARAGAEYATKYVSKQWCSDDWPRSRRRWSAPRGSALLRKPSKREDGIRWVFVGSWTLEYSEYTASAFGRDRFVDEVQTLSIGCPRAEDSAGRAPPDWLLQVSEDLLCVQSRLTFAARVRSQGESWENVHAQVLVV